MYVDLAESIWCTNVTEIINLPLSDACGAKARLEVQSGLWQGEGTVESMM